MTNPVDLARRYLDRMPCACGRCPNSSRVQVQAANLRRFVELPCVVLEADTLCQVCGQCHPFAKLYQEKDQ